MKLLRPTTKWNSEAGKMITENGIDGKPSTSGQWKYVMKNI